MLGIPLLLGVGGCQGNMPVFGLAAATKHVPAVGRKETARRRLGGDSEPADEFSH